MAQTINHSIVIAIDMRQQALHYYTMLGEDRSSISHQVKYYTAKGLDDTFFAKFKEAVAAFVADTPSEEVQKISVIVPDEAVALDNVRLPALRSSRLLQNAINVKLDDIYSNREDLKIITYMAEKNRQYCTYNVAAIQNRIYNAVCGACSENKLLVDSLTYASASTITAVSALCPAWKNENYLFLDIQDVYARFIFATGGRCVGFYTLPFGLEFLTGGKYVQEDMLFDHTMSELTVVNARERAKAKRLSVLAETSDEASREMVNLEAMLVTNETDEGYDEEGKEREIREARMKNSGLNAKVLPKKTPRRLPQFMQRPIPETKEEIVKENFRVFVKWALSLIQNNPTLTALGAPKFVAVNLPQTLGFVIDALKDEEAETKIPFVRFNGADGDTDLARNLQLFGGLNAKNWHSAVKF